MGAVTSALYVLGGGRAFAAMLVSVVVVSGGEGALEHVHQTCCQGQPVRQLQSRGIGCPCLRYPRGPLIH